VDRRGRAHPAQALPVVPDVTERKVDLAEWEEHLRQEVEADLMVGDTEKTQIVLASVTPSASAVRRPYRLAIDTGVVVCRETSSIGRDNCGADTHATSRRRVVRK
jgi:hypothetical protein